MDNAEPGGTGSISWLRSHGYVLNDAGIWVDKIYHNMMLAQAAAVAEARAWRERQGLPQRPEPEVF